MQPIIRRTITITVTETWTITWPDGRETTWHETQELAQPAISKSDERLTEITNADDAVDQVADNE